MKATKWPRPVVTADGDGVVSHAGSYLLTELADRVGLTAALTGVRVPAAAAARP